MQPSEYCFNESKIIFVHHADAFQNNGGKVATLPTPLSVCYKLQYIVIRVAAEQGAATGLTQRVNHPRRF